MQRSDSSSSQSSPKQPDSALVRFLVHHPLTILLTVLIVLLGSVLAISTAFIRKDKLTLPAAAALSGLSQQHYREGDYEKSIAINEQLNQGKRASWYTEMTTGNAYFKQGDYARAEQHYKRATELNNTLPMPFLNLALTYYKQGKMEQARSTYQHVLTTFHAEFPSFSKKAEQALNLLQ